VRNSKEFDYNIKRDTIFVVNGGGWDYFVKQDDFLITEESGLGKIVFRKTGNIIK